MRSVFYFYGEKMAKNRKKNGYQKVKTINFKCKNESQKQAIKTIEENDITVLLGPAGTGKTIISIALALQGFLKNDYKKIVLTRPVVEAGERLGHLPGTLEEKMHPYMIPFLDFLRKFLDRSFIEECFNKEVFEIEPLAYMRGRTFDDSLILIDEAQNATKDQLLMALTRIGYGSKVIVTGDPGQSDINGKSRLEEIARSLNKREKMACFEFSKSDIVRNPIISEIIEAFNEISR